MKTSHLLPTANSAGEKSNLMSPWTYVQCADQFTGIPDAFLFKANSGTAYNAQAKMKKTKIDQTQFKH